jgi:hypothetical protein
LSPDTAAIGDISTENCDAEAVGERFTAPALSTEVSAVSRRPMVYSGLLGDVAGCESVAGWCTPPAAAAVTAVARAAAGITLGATVDDTVAGSVVGSVDAPTTADGALVAAAAAVIDSADTAGASTTAGDGATLKSSPTTVSKGELSTTLFAPLASTAVNDSSVSRGASRASEWRTPSETFSSLVTAVSATL